MTKKSPVKKPTLEKWEKGEATKMTYFQVKVKKIELFWLQAWAAERGRSLSDLSREGLSILRKLPDDLLELAFLESVKRQILSNELIENALRKELKIPIRRLKKTEKIELSIPVGKQIRELKARMLKRKSTGQKVIQKKIAAGDE